MDKGKMHNGGRSVPLAIGIGAAVSFGATLIISAILAMLISSGNISPNAVGYGVMGLLMISSVAGAMASTLRIEGKRLIVSTLTAAVYFLLLLCTNALIFDGMYKGIPATAMVILAGGVINALLPVGKKKQTPAYIRKKRYG